MTILSQSKLNNCVHIVYLWRLVINITWRRIEWNSRRLWAEITERQETRANSPLKLTARTQKQHENYYFSMSYVCTWRRRTALSSHLRSFWLKFSIKFAVFLQKCAHKVDYAANLSTPARFKFNFNFRESDCSQIARARLLMARWAKKPRRRAR